MYLCVACVGCPISPPAASCLVPKYQSALEELCRLNISAGAYPPTALLTQILGKALASYTVPILCSSHHSMPLHSQQGKKNHLSLNHATIEQLGKHKIHKRLFELEDEKIPLCLSPLGPSLPPHFYVSAHE